MLVLSAWILCLGALWSPQAMAVGQPSTYTGCANRTATVAWGGTVNVDLTFCHFFGLGVVSTAPTHGTATPGDPAPIDTYNYNHNGSSPGGGGTDTFVVLDDNSDFITITVTIQPPVSPITVNPASLPAMSAGTPFSQTLSSTGGLAPYTYTLESGTLPLGLTLSSAGVISGTPTQRGGYAFTVRSSDAITPTSQFTDKGYSGTVSPAPLSISPASATAVQSVPFSQTLAITGGVAPHSCQLESGAFPAGISISSGCVISGTSSAAAGNYPVTIRVTDSSTGVGSHFELESFTLTVSPTPSVSIAVSPASVSEDGATNLTYTVTRSLNISSPTVVNLTVSGTATSGVDYTGAPANITIPAGATTATFTINPTVDGIVEADETVIFTVAAGTGYTVGAPASATGTILNDDVPSVTISVSPSSVAEDGAPNLVYTITLNQPSFSALSIGYTIGGTATNGVDYVTIASPLIIPAGSTSGTITVNPIADATIETNETVILTLSAGTGYTVGVPNSATGTILNDDLPNLAINDVTASEGNAGTTNFTFTVSLSAPAGPAGVTFDIATANSTATAGVDYVSNSLTGQTIPEGSSTYTFTVVVNGDVLNEPSENFFVNVTNVVNAVVVDGQGVGTIANDDPLPSLSINDVTVTEGNAGTVNAVFTVTLSAASGQTVSVNYATADGTATQPADYTNTSGSLTFTPGQTTRTITVPVIGDTVPEASETFFVNLSSATNATISDNQGVGTITNDDVPVTVNPATVPNGTVAAAYSQTITASGGTAPYGFGITAGALPAGLTLSPGGVLSGTPNAGGTFNFTVTATDNSAFPGPFSGSQAYTLVIAPPTVVLPVTTLAGGTLGSPYSAAITAASGGTAPYSYSVTAGALPGGLALNPTTGAITSTPSALGTFNFSITATDSSTGTGPYAATRSYAITVIDVPPAANAVSLTTAYNAAATNVPLNITGGAPTSVAIVTPPTKGTAIVSGTTITYQPNTGYAGPDSFTHSATNSGGTSAPATVSITVQDPVITITPSGGLAATVAAPYTQTFTFNGGAQPWSGYQVTNLPTGVTITGTTANTVTISGTPTQAGTFSLNVSATDSSTGNGPYTVGQAFILTVAAPTLAMTPAPGVLNVTYATAFTQAFAASGGIGPYSYAVTGTLPTGLSLIGNAISGTPTVPGSYPITVTATDTGASGTGAPFSVARNYTINVSSPTIALNPTTLPNGAVAAPYSQTIAATGGAAPFTFAVTAGALPAGVTLAPGGALSGTPTASGSFNFTVTASDGNGQTGFQSYSITIGAPTVVLPAATLPAATAGVPYSSAITPASGGTAPYAYAVTVGALPTGLLLNLVTGAITGTTNVVGTANFSVTATDSTTGTGPFTATRAYSIAVGQGTSSTTLSSSVNPSTFGQSVVFSATVTSPAGTPTGTVTFKDGSTTLGTGTLAGGTTTIATSALSVGARSITAEYGGAAGFASSASAVFTQNVNQATQTITFAKPSDVIFSVGGTRTLSATGGASGLPVTFASTTTGVCTTGGTNGATVTYVTGGTCSITASQAGNASYAAAADVSHSFAIGVAAQTITFAKPSDVTFSAGGTRALSATGGASGLPVTFASTTTGVCTTGGTNGATVTYVTGGTCSITASQAGNASYAAAADVSHSFAIGVAAQTITFAKPSDVTFSAGGTRTLSATGGASGLPVTFASTTSSVCTTGGTNGATVTYVAPGTCSITASQAGNTSYAAAADVAQSFGISQIQVSLSLSAPTGQIQVGQSVVYTATVTASSTSQSTTRMLNTLQSNAFTVVTGSVTFQRNGQTACANVPVSGNQATCAVMMTTPGSHSITASFNGGNGAFANATSSAVVAAVVDSIRQTSEVIGRFMSRRNDMIASNSFDDRRQITRLEEADTAEQQAPSAGLADGANTASRLGAGSDGVTVGRVRAGLTPGATAARDGLADAMKRVPGAADDKQGTGAQGSLVQALGINGSEDMTRLSFSSSLSGFRRYLADTEAAKSGGAALGFAGSQKPAGAAFSPFDLWVEGKYASFRDRSSLTTGAQSDDGHFGLLTLGADYVVSKRMLIGAFVQFDSMSVQSPTATAQVTGKGWMAGPYATIRLAPNIYWQARAGWGTSRNEVRPYNTYTDRFDSTRWLGATTLSGRFTRGALTITPSIGVTYMSDTSEAYVDTFGAVIPAVKTSLGQMKVGPEFSYRHRLTDTLEIEPHIGAHVIWNFDAAASAAGVTVDRASGPEGVRGRLELGLRGLHHNGIGFSISGTYDGIGAAGFTSVTGKAAVRIPLQ